MTRVLLALTALLWVAAPASAGSKGANSGIQYVGAITINASQDVQVLVDWYERFGIHTDGAGGVYFGAFESAAGPFYFGIHPRQPGAAARSSGSVSVVLRVGDYDQYLANAAKNKIAPQSTESGPEGRFAHFIDPDGNEMTIWGN